MTKDEMLELAVKNYPKGTRYKSAFSNCEKEVILDSDNFHWDSFKTGILDSSGGYVYDNSCKFSKSGWAEIVSTPNTVLANYAIC